MSETKLKEIYIVELEDHFGIYLPSKCPTISYAPKKGFKEFISEVREAYPGYKTRNVRDPEIVNRVKRRMAWDKSSEISSLYKLKTSASR